MPLFFPELYRKICQRLRTVGPGLRAGGEVVRVAGKLWIAVVHEDVIVQGALVTAGMMERDQSLVAIRPEVRARHQGKPAEPVRVEKNTVLFDDPGLPLVGLRAQPELIGRTVDGVKGVVLVPHQRIGEVIAVLDLAFERLKRDRRVRGRIDGVSLDRVEEAEVLREYVEDDVELRCLVGVRSCAIAGDVYTEGSVVPEVGIQVEEDPAVLPRCAGQVQPLVRDFQVGSASEPPVNGSVVAPAFTRPATKADEIGEFEIKFGPTCHIEGAGNQQGRRLCNRDLLVFGKFVFTVATVEPHAAGGQKERREARVYFDAAVSVFISLMQLRSLAVVENVLTRFLPFFQG